MFDLTNRKMIMDLLNQQGRRLRKSLGQHFLVDRRVLDKIVEVSDLQSTDMVVEIGAGIGTLTQELCRRVAKVKAYELDEELAKLLAKQVGVCCPNLEIEVGDFLSKRFESKTPYKVVANLPYQITTPVIRYFLGQLVLPERMVFLVQKEVAERLAALPGNRERGWLTVAVQLFGQPQVAMIVKPASFWPAPEVESAVLVISNLEAPTDVPIKEVLRVVKAGFSEKRRQLPNALAGGLGLDINLVRQLVGQAKIEPRRRAETLTNDEWIRLTHEITKVVV